MTAYVLHVLLNPSKAREAIEVRKENVYQWRQ
jgi:hypothetical protein